MTGHTGNLSPKEAANNLFEQIQKLDANSSGNFLYSNGDELPW